MCTATVAQHVDGLVGFAFVPDTLHPGAIHAITADLLVEGGDALHVFTGSRYLSMFSTKQTLSMHRQHFPLAYLPV